MRRDVILDKRQVRCPNASTIGFDKWKCQVGDVFTYRYDWTDAKGQEQSYSSSGRMIARIAYAPRLADDKDKPYSAEAPAGIKGWILAMELSPTGDSIYERWINPAWVTRVHACPTLVPAFFYAPKIAYDAETIRGLIDYGTMSEHYIDKVADRVAEVRRIADANADNSPR